MKTPDDITECGEEYEVHPHADKNGKRTGWWVVIHWPTGEALGQYADKQAAIGNAKWLDAQRTGPVNFPTIGELAKDSP